MVKLKGRLTEVQLLLSFVTVKMSKKVQIRMAGSHKSVVIA